MRRREFISLLGVAAAWPLAARAQQPERTRRVGVLMTLAADDPQSMARIAAFLQGLQQLGWTDGRDVRIEYRWGAADADRIRKGAFELVLNRPRHPSNVARVGRRGDRVTRREFITLLGGATAWPLAARAQQRAMTVIAFPNRFFC
jgi:hypothetical protein